MSVLIGCTCTAAEMVAHLCASQRPTTFSPAALVEHHCVRGIAYLIGENWGGGWRSGDVVVIWQDGERTVLPEEMLVVHDDLWRSFRQEIDT